MQIRSAKALRVYQEAFDLAMQNLREAWAKRRYEAHFLSKLTDCDGENAETDTSLDFALACGYINDDEHHNLIERSTAIGRMLGSMINRPEKFTIARS